MPGFGSRLPDLAHAHPVDEVGEVLVVHDDRHVLQRRRLRSQRCIAACQRCRKESARASGRRRALAGSICARRSASTSATFAMLRGSRWMCGLPPGMNVAERRGRSTFGISSRDDELRRLEEAGRAAAGCGCCPTASAAAAASRFRARSRSRPRDRRCARARSGSGALRCDADPAARSSRVYTLTLSPPSSCASAPHSGSQAKTFSAAAPAMANAQKGAKRKALKIDCHDALLRTCARRARPGS